jgi:hypothetical protein
MPDAVALLRNYRPEGKPLVLAARVSGAASTAFPKASKATKPKEEPPTTPASEVLKKTPRC